MAFPVTESAAATFVAGSWRLGEHSDEGPGGLLTFTRKTWLQHGSIHSDVFEAGRAMRTVVKRGKAYTIIWNECLPRQIFEVS